MKSEKIMESLKQLSEQETPRKKFFYLGRYWGGVYLSAVVLTLYVYLQYAFYFGYNFSSAIEKFFKFIIPYRAEQFSGYFFAIVLLLFLAFTVVNDMKYWLERLKSKRGIIKSSIGTFLATLAFLWSIDACLMIWTPVLGLVLPDWFFKPLDIVGRLFFGLLESM